MTVGFAILLTAGLSFVGAGVRPPAPELGSMIAGGAKFLIVDQWWPALFPGIALGLIVFSFGVFGEIVDQVRWSRALCAASTRRRAWRSRRRRAGDRRRRRPRRHRRSWRCATLRCAATGRRAPLLQRISFSLGAGECLAIVGKSGSGKSLLVRSVLGLLPPRLAVTEGKIRYGEDDLLALDKRALRALRSKQIAAILPNAKSQLHPLTTVGGDDGERARGPSKRSARPRPATLDRAARHGRAGRPRTPPRRLSARAQRRDGATGLPGAGAHVPTALLVADEPTAGLDVTIQRQVLDLMQKLARDRGTAQLIVTGDLGIAAHYCDRVAVMQAGRIVELNDTKAFFAAPRHPYSQHLLSCVKV